MDSNLLSKLQAQHLPQALLLIGQESSRPVDLAQQLVAHSFCESDVKPCGHCRPCQLLQQSAHPDLLVITQEKPGAAVKIEQIRSLQQEVYQTAQCATHRVIMIYPADELNRAAANALLKILEEPPAHAHFILIAAHLDTLPATIMSRCQSYHMPEPLQKSAPNTPGYLSLGLHYDESSPRGVLFQEHAKFIQKLSEASQNQQSVCQLAAQYTNHALIDMLWLLQLVTTTLLQYQLLPEQQASVNTHLAQLAEKHSPVHYFKQLDMILEFIKKINQDIPLNPALALETLLMEYV